MTTADLPSALRLWDQAEGVELDLGDGHDELVRYLERNPGCSHVAVADGILVGAVLAGHDGRRGYLYHLAVAQTARGAGLGRLLVERAVAALRQQGIPRALILVVRDNAAGFAFWRRCGWEDLQNALPMLCDL